MSLVANTPSPKVRLDKWLWAARFFRTRSLAKQAIDNGRVMVDGQRAKPSRDVSIGAQVNITRGDEIYDVAVIALDDVRRSAPLAQRMYQETEQSRVARNEQRAKGVRRSYSVGPAARPGKRDRRALERLKQQTDSDDDDG